MCLETMEKAFQWRRKSNLEVTDKQSRIQIPESEVRIRESDPYQIVTEPEHWFLSKISVDN
jgi:hypothetical protein